MSALICGYTFNYSVNERQMYAFNICEQRKWIIMYWELSHFKLLELWTKAECEIDW